MAHPPMRADGKVETLVTHLEMLTPPEGPVGPAPRFGLSMIQALHPTVSFYRYLYDTVGAAWLWIDRRKLSNDALAAIIQDPRVSVHVLHADGVPAGYVELDARVEGEVEIAYFGLIPEFIGQKLGPYMLRWAIDAAWKTGPRRVWVHTCTLDHPGALSMYEKAGFVRFKQEIEVNDDLRAM